VLVQRIRSHGPDDPVLQSHAISREAAEALLHDSVEQFLLARKAVALNTLITLAERCAGWSRHDRDRPSIAYLLQRARISK
jgi:hypothetical protein